jgi:hypothetical protein
MRSNAPWEPEPDPAGVRGGGGDGKGVVKKRRLVRVRPALGGEADTDLDSSDDDRHNRQQVRLPNAGLLLNSYICVNHMCAEHERL